MEKNTTPRKRVLHWGDNGYGQTSCTAASKGSVIELTRTDPHDWGRVSESFSIHKEDLPVLIEFLKQHVKG